MSSVAFLDFEASGLQGFPVEVAWVAGDLTAAGSWLIAPGAWIGGDPLPDPPLWDPDAERLHGLTLERLRADGRPPATVAQALRDDLAAYEAVISDCREKDEDWLKDLFAKADVDGMPSLAAVEETEYVDKMYPYFWPARHQLNEARRQVGEAVGLRRHHALDDAVSQAVWLCVARRTDWEIITTRARAVLLQHGRPETRARMREE